VPSLLEAINRAQPERIALDDGRRQVCYAQLGPLVAAEIAWLVASGARRFALAADNSVSWVLADLALHAGRMVAVPLPGYFTPEQQLHALDDAGIEACLTDDPARYLERWPGWSSSASSPQTGLTLLRRPLAQTPRPGLPEAVSKVTYTSGSTARPRGVCLAAKDLEVVAGSLAAATASAGVTRHLCLLPLPTLLENIAGVYVPLLMGATCLLPPAAITGMSYGDLDPARLLACVSAARPESLILVPELLRVLVHAAGHGWRVPESLRFIAVGGASVSIELLAAAASLGLPVYEGYGLSECASVVTLNTPAARRLGSAGRPLPHCQVRVAVDGELQVSGVIMRGYLGGTQRPPGAALATGDLGEVDEDGYVYVRGRRGNVFITSLGRNVSPEWVERELLAETGIQQAVVEGEARVGPVALIVASPGTPVAARVAAANSRLPDYAQVRRFALLNQPLSLADGLLTANGRPRRVAIRERYAALLDALPYQSMAS
jgi:long-chain acyl-CoA synthetase